MRNQKCLGTKVLFSVGSFLLMMLVAVSLVCCGGGGGGGGGVSSSPIPAAATPGTPSSGSSPAADYAGSVDDFDDWLTAQPVNDEDHPYVVNLTGLTTANQIKSIKLEISYTAIIIIIMKITLQENMLISRRLNFLPV